MQYETIIFMQGHEALEPLDILKEQGEEAAIEYLLQWDYGESGEWIDVEPYGTGSKLYRVGNLILCYHSGIGYVGLTREHGEVTE